MRFSVITVNYNNVEGLHRTIKSVLCQDYADFEYIIIDGGSTDGSVDVIKQYVDLLSYWVSEPDGGVYEGMNKAMAVAHGEHCIFMNSGDEFYSPTVLSDVAGMGSAYDLGVGKSCSMNKGILGRIVAPPAEQSLLFWENYSVIHQAAFMRTDMLRERGYDTVYRIVADWKYMLTEYLTHEYRYASLPVIVCKFEGGGMSDDAEKRNAERRRALQELLPPMLLKDAKKMSALRLLSANDKLRQRLCHILESRTLTKVLCLFLWLLCKIK